MKAKMIDDETAPTELIVRNMSIGDKGMVEPCASNSSYKALKKSLVLTLHKKDLIEVLTNSKVIEESKRQTFLLKCQFLNELTFNRVLEFNHLIQEQRFYPGDILFD